MSDTKRSIDTAVPALAHTAPSPTGGARRIGTRADVLATRSRSASPGTPASPALVTSDGLVATRLVRSSPSVPLVSSAGPVQSPWPVTSIQPARRRLATTLVLDVLLVVGAVVAYFGTRGLTAGSREVAVAHALDILRLERALGLDHEAGTQAALGGQPWLTTVANWIYIWGHWPAIGAAFVWLAVRHRAVFRRLRDAMVISGLLGLCVYTTYPVAPPRLAGLGLVDTVSEQSQAYRVLQPPAFVNQYAAMPSLHVGWDLLLGLALLAAAGGWLLRTVGRVMPVAMAAATVLTANHYLLDVLAGAALGLVGWSVAGRLEQRRARRSSPGLRRVGEHLPRIHHRGDL